MIYWKNARLDHMKTALLFMCEVARNSPDGEKSIERGAFLNRTQSTRLPVIMSQTRMLRSIEEQRSHLESGCEKQMSVILFQAALAKNLTLLRPDLAFNKVIERSDCEIATRSFCLLQQMLSTGKSAWYVLISFPLKKSQSLTVLSRLVETRFLFSESIAKPVIS